MPDFRFGHGQGAATSATPEEAIAPDAVFGGAVVAIRFPDIALTRRHGPLSDCGVDECWKRHRVTFLSRAGFLIGHPIRIAHGSCPPDLVLPAPIHRTPQHTHHAVRTPL